MIEDQNWRLRVIAKTRGNQTMMGATIIAMLGHEPQNPPYIRGLAVISEDGVLWACLRGRRDVVPKLRPLFPLTLWVDELKRLADMCKLTDTEVTELFDEARKWIWRDHRATSTIQ